MFFFATPSPPFSLARLCDAIFCPIVLLDSPVPESGSAPPRPRRTSAADEEQRRCLTPAFAPIVGLMLSCFLKLSESQVREIIAGDA